MMAKARPGLAADQVMARIRALESLGIKALRARWVEVHGAPPSTRWNRALLVRGLAHRLQEEALGGLAPALRAHLAELAARLATDPDTPLAAPPQIKPGTRLIRAWHGERASLLTRDILFPLLISGRNPAECGHSRPIVRTTGAGQQAHFGPFSLSPGAPSLTQPNHGHFGTDVRIAPSQWVRWSPRGRGFERAALRRGKQGSNDSFLVRQHLGPPDLDRMNTSPRKCSSRPQSPAPASPEAGKSPFR